MLKMQYCVDLYNVNDINVENPFKTTVVFCEESQRWFCTRNESIGYGIPCRHEVILAI